ncbi:alpha-1-acid glycoprotein 2-like [Trichechus inunguis]
MALPWALAVLSLLPLLDAQDPACAILKPAPVTNATLERPPAPGSILSSPGSWGEAVTSWVASSGIPLPPEPEAPFQGDYPYLLDHLTLFSHLVSDFSGGQCVYNSSYLQVQRENGTLSRYEWGAEQFANVLLTKNPTTFMFSHYPEDKLNRGLSFYADKQEVTEEQLREFHEALKCMGLRETEVLYTDGKKDLCGPLEKQHEEERKKENKGSQVDTELG